MSCFKSGLMTPFFILLMLALFINHSAEASVWSSIGRALGRAGKGNKNGIQTAGPRKNTFIPKVPTGEEGFKRAYETYDLTGKLTDNADCKVDFCKQPNYNPLKCSICKTKKITHPLENNP